MNTVKKVTPTTDSPSFKSMPSSNKKSNKKSILAHSIAAALITLAASTAAAIEPFKLADIQATGLQRVDAGTVFSYLPVKVGDTLDDTLIRESIKSLFATGLFTDVSIDARNGVMRVIVQERPTIAAITYTGNKEFDAAEIKKILNEAGLSESRPFDKAVVARAEQELKKAYLARSKYGLQLTTTSSPVDRNRVNVLIDFVEGEIAKIKEIKIIGNKAFTEKQIIDEMKSRTPGVFTWFTKTDRYAKEKVEADLEAIRNFYINQGYFEFNVVSNQVNVSADKADVFVTVTLQEGEQLRLNSLNVKSANPEVQAALLASNTIKTGTIFSGEAMNQQLAAFNTKLGQLGYANPNINLVPTINKENKTIDFVADIDPGMITYVRKILITGNTKTRDAVVRREVTQIESSTFDADKIRVSRDRIDRLGYFKEVGVDVVNVDQRADLIDVIFTVSEKPTGNLSFGLGYNSTDKVSLNAGISQDNIFGTGNNLAFSVNTAASSRSFTLSATDPYFTDSGISRSFDVYARDNKLKTDNIETVDIRTFGLSARLGVPVTKDDVVYFGAGLEYTGLKLKTNPPQRYKDLFNQIQGAAIYPLLTSGWGNDTRDSSLSPTKGVLKRAGLELGVGSEISYARATYQYQKYVPLNKDFTVAVNADLGYGAPLRGKPYPFFKNFFVGGIGSVRGYEGNSLGSKDGIDYIGGSRKAVLNAELLFPLPGTGKDRSARLFTFADAGYAWADGQKISTSDLRYSAGVGLSWQSPIGPLKFSYGWPIKKNIDDKLQKFQFQIGTGF